MSLKLSFSFLHFKNEQKGERKSDRMGGYKFSEAAESIFCYSEAPVWPPLANVMVQLPTAPTQARTGALMRSCACLSHHLASWLWQGLQEALFEKVDLGEKAKNLNCLCSNCVRTMLLIKVK